MAKVLQQRGQMLSTMGQRVSEVLGADMPIGGVVRVAR